ncbi:hypothetical protein CYK37_29605 [Mesorhizobium loti]|nr:peptidase C39 family protein [Mesorhizobium loti]PLP55597.1 hypothetical protein CYK37_29605 [Mesorhizobium loti]
MPYEIIVKCIDQADFIEKTVIRTLSTHLDVGTGNRNQLFFVAFQQNQIVGALLAFRRPTTTMVRLVKLWINSPGDGAAIGTAIFLALEDWSVQAGIHAWRISADWAADDFPEDFVALLNVDRSSVRGGYLQRWLTKRSPLINSATFLYPQTTDFTCGAACLMMAFATLDQSVIPHRRLELQLWREATSVVSLDGPGGCDPYGVALAAAARGFATSVFISTSDTVLIEAEDSDANRDIIAFAQAQLRSSLTETLVEVKQQAFSIEQLRSAIGRGAAAIVLVDQLETHGRTVPHWILIHSADETFFLANDPWFERTDQELPIDVVDLPIGDAVLDKMCWYGTPPYRAAVLIEPRV